MFSIVLCVLLTILNRQLFKIYLKNQPKVYLMKADNVCEFQGKKCIDHNLLLMGVC